VTYGFLLSALSSLNVHANALTVDVSADDFGVQLELHTLLGENPLHSLGHIRIHTGPTDGTQVLDDGDLSPQTRPNGSLANVSLVHGILATRGYQPSQAR